jgi:hypothetical protein
MEILALNKSVKNKKMMPDIFTILVEDQILQGQDASLMY